MSIIIDLICAVIFAGFVLYGWRKGFFRMLVNLLGTLGLFLVSFLSSKAAAPILYEKYIGPYFAERINHYITNVGDGVRMESVVVNALGKIPSFCKTMLLAGSDVDTFVQSVSTAVDQKVQNVADYMVYQLMPSVILPLVQGILFLLLFILLFLLLHWLILLLGNHASEKSLVGRVDCICGGVCGLGVGFIVLLVLAFVAQLIVQFSADGLSFCNTALIEKTFLFKLFYQIINAGIATL